MHCRLTDLIRISVVYLIFFFQFELKLLIKKKMLEEVRSKNHEYGKIIETFIKFITINVRYILTVICYLIIFLF